MVFLLQRGLVKDLCLLEADLEAKELNSACKTGCDSLCSSFCVGNEGSVVCEEELPHQPFLGLRVGLQAL